MQGFADKALILFPTIDHYQNKNNTYKYQFKTAVKNIVSYLRSQCIEPVFFYTDDLAREFDDGTFTYASTLSKADRFFISQHCCGTNNALEKAMIEYDDIYNAILANDPWSPGMSEEEQFEMILRHSSKAASKIIPMYKIVVHFILHKRAQYKVPSKPGDGKIRINVSADTFSPKVFMSGNEENACDVLNVPFGNRCLDCWEV